MKGGYYIRRQTNAGKNQGKWRVHGPNALSIGPPCETRSQAAHVAAVFNLASEHPEHGTIAGIEAYWGADSPDYRERCYPYKKSGC